MEIKEKLDTLKKEIIRLIKLIDNNEWQSADIIIQFAPFINKGFKTLPSFWDLNNERVRLFLNYNEEFLHKFFSFIASINQENLYNQIVLKTKKNDYENTTIEISFNPEIEDNFQNNIPKSKRGRTIPWWKNPDETKGLSLIP